MNFLFHCPKVFVKIESTRIKKLFYKFIISNVLHTNILIQTKLQITNTHTIHILQLVLTKLIFFLNNYLFQVIAKYHASSMKLMENKPFKEIWK